jgi:hypothetical protein
MCANWQLCNAPYGKIGCLTCHQVTQHGATGLIHPVAPKPPAAAAQKHPASAARQPAEPRQRQVLLPTAVPKVQEQVVLLQRASQVRGCWAAARHALRWGGGGVLGGVNKAVRAVMGWEDMRACS